MSDLNNRWKEVDWTGGPDRVMRQVKNLLDDFGNEAVNERIIEGFDFNDYMPLHKAVEAGDKAVVELLISLGADVNATSKNGCSPLHDAAIGGHMDIAQLLIAHGANVDARSANGCTPLHDATFKGNAEMAKLLIANGANVNASSDIGNTPLHNAAYHGYQDITDLLITNDANPDVKNKDGKTPLDVADRRTEDFMIHAIDKHRGSLKQTLTEWVVLEPTEPCKSQQFHPDKDVSMTVVNAAVLKGMEH